MRKACGKLHRHGGAEPSPHDDATSATLQQLRSLSQTGDLEECLELLESEASSRQPLQDQSIYLSLLKLCTFQKARPQAKRLYTHLSRHNLHISPFLGENLVLSLARCGALSCALQLFGQLPQRTVFSWTGLISGFVENGRGLDAIRLHRHMIQDGHNPDRYTFSTLFKAIGSIRDVKAGKSMQSLANSRGFGSDLFVVTSILSMYGKCGDIRQAEDLFSTTLCRDHDVVCWNAMLTAYVDNSQGEKALLLYRQMQEIGMYPPTHQTIVVALQACGMLVSDHKESGMILEIGEGLHSFARNNCILSHVFVHTTLVSMYGKCGAIEKAENVFIGQSKHHLSLWNAMISSYVEQGYGDKALRFFRLMQTKGVIPDQRTYAVTIQACVSLASSREKSRKISLDVGQALHIDAHVHGFSSDTFVGTTLISLYGKIGEITKAEEVFALLCKAGGDASIPWNAMLSAYIDQAQKEKVLTLYKQMEEEEEEDITLDVTSLICILQACNEVGSLNTCYSIHFAIVSMQHDDDVFLRSALIHGYGGSGSMVDASSVHDAMPNVDSVSRNACLAGYAGEGNYGEIVRMFAQGHFVGIKPDGITYASVMSACNHAGRVSVGIHYFVSMTEDHDISPDSRHYVCITDLLGRAGDFKKVEDVVHRMSCKVDLSMCLFLLGSCRMHGNVGLAREMFEHVVSLEPMQATAYVSMSNIYAEAQNCV